MKEQHLFRVIIGNANTASVDYDARFNVVARDVPDAIKRVHKEVERGELIMSVEHIARVDKP
jgi:hypothetical protein